MILRYPDYYEHFSCIAGRCEDTCCAGWEIDLDDETYEAYMEVPGDFGRELRDKIKDYDLEEEEVYESHGFCLGPDGRCPFLDQDNLCRIYKKFGEKALSYVCTHTPRNYLEYGGSREIAISVSCPEAGRLIFGQREKMSLVEKEIEEDFPWDESPEELWEAKTIQMARDRVIEILQNRDCAIEQRICQAIAYGKRVQDCLNGGDLDRVADLEPGDIGPLEAGDGYQYFLGRVKSYSQMDSINQTWDQTLLKIKEAYLDDSTGVEQYAKDRENFQSMVREKERDHWLEQLIVYEAFLCLARSVDGMDFLGQIKFAVASYLMILDMNALDYRAKGENFGLEDFSANARIYAKEVEHSEANLELLAEDCLFEEAYEVDHLMEAVLTLT
ncbi:MAG: flagellin lysine-N-methylase [Eubacterium sp.]|nr:flagellin lysine-N-methylase [Eubacterium sp.]